MSIRELIDAHDDGATEFENITKAVVDDLCSMRKQELRDHLFSLVHDEVRRCARSRVREAESVRSDGTPADPTKPRRDLMEERFFAGPERGYVLWGEATADDHLARAQYLREMAGGLIGTAEKHEAAAERIASNGVTCLNDLGGEL